MGLMDLFNQGDIRDKIYAAANRNNVPQGGVTGAAFNALFPHGLGNLAFGRQPQANPDLASPEGTQYMADLASNMMVPGTFIGPKGMSRMFGDDTARGLMSAADVKLSQGVPREQVFQELGVFKGPEGKWRYEIDDSGMTGNRGGMGSYGVAESPEVFVSKVGDAVNHDALFSAHPSLRYMNLEVNPAHDTLGSHYEGNIALKGDVSTQREWVSNAQKLADEFAEIDFKAGDFPSLEEARGYHNAEFANDAKYGDLSSREASTLLHELQHAVQGREGFAAGGSPQMFDRGQMFSPKARDLNEDLSRHLSGGISAQPQELFDSLKYGEPSELAAIAQKHGFGSIDEAILYLKQEDAARTPFGQYQRLAGEAESRAVQDRMNMNMDQRRASFPEYATRDGLIVRGGSGGLMSAMSDDWQPLADRIKNIRQNINSAKQSGNVHPTRIQNMNDTIARLEQEVLDKGGQVDPKLVGYEWKSKDGEVYSRWDDGAVSKRISDWENKEVSERSGRDIVHTYFIRGANGEARPFGKQSAIKELVESGVATTPRDAEFLLKKIKEQGR